MLLNSCRYFDVDFCSMKFDPEKRKVMLLYSAGFNSLSYYLKSDIKELMDGYLPGNAVNDDIVLVYSHHTGNTGKYSVQTEPSLVRLYKSDGKVVADTLVKYPVGTISSSAVQLNKVLEQVRTSYPAGSYGMVFSSHATGYLPVGYYAAPDVYEGKESIPFGLSRGSSFPEYDSASPVRYVEPKYDPSLPMVKSIGQDVVIMEGVDYSYEMDIIDFAGAIPMYLDYILFDACLMGGVEVACELKDVCGLVGFSQAEVLAEGFDYSMLTTYLLGGEEPDPVKVCESYFKRYDAMSGVNRSATISVFDCSRIDALVDVCGTLFDKYNEVISVIDPSLVQQYYRYDYHWFYDLESILLAAGVSDEEMAAFRSAMEECMIYKAATPSFMNAFEIKVFSGLSMFLPSNGGAFLKNYYKGLEWNKLTGLLR